MYAELKGDNNNGINRLKTESYMAGDCREFFIFCWLREEESQNNVVKKEK
jgi:hypothetical protein